MFFRWFAWLRLKAPSPATNLVVNLTRTTVFRPRYHHPHRRRHTMTTATLRWTDPVTRVDGSALAAAEIANVSIFDTRSDGSVDFLGDVLPGVQSFKTGALDVGDHAFFVVVKDTAGHASARSNVGAATVVKTLAEPSAVTDLSVVLE